MRSKMQVVVRWFAAVPGAAAPAFTAAARGVEKASDLLSELYYRFRR